MKRKLIIFGSGKTAELAYYYFTVDSQYEVVAFTVDSIYLDSDTFCGIPVYRFEDIETRLPVKTVCFFAAISNTQMNKVREDKVKEAKRKGYNLASYISTKATLFGNVKLGEHCYILEDNTIQPFVEIGDNNTLWSGNHIGHHSKIGHNNFITSHVVISGNTVIGNNCFLGVNSSLRGGVEIADVTLIGAASFISRTTEEKGVYKTSFAEKYKLNSNQI